MNERSTAAEAEAEDVYTEEISAFVERFAADLSEVGVPRMPARVFSCVLASHSGALSAAQLASRLRVSPAAVSGAVRYLSHLRLLSRERQPGSRRESYRLHRDVWYEMLTRRDTVIRGWVSTLNSGIDVVGRDTPAGRRLAESAGTMEIMLGKLQDVLQHWHEHRTTGGDTRETGF